VLDTNIVLDCFVFDDPSTRDLTRALESHRVEALVHDLALDELQRVLAYPHCRLAAAEQDELLERYRAVATSASMPDGFNRETLLLPPEFPRCRDSDDEPFLALAYHACADGLITKDKAVLRLRRKARRFGVAIFEPRELPAHNGWPARD
jgi:putative PIN family toxin of toxin-antitoxin system